MTETQEALPPIWLNGLLPKPMSRQQGRGRQRGGSGAAGQHRPCTAQAPHCHVPNPCPFPGGQCQAAGRGTNRCWSGCKPRAEWVQHPSQSMEDLDLPRGMGRTSTCGDIIVCILFSSPEAKNTSQLAFVQRSSPPMPSLEEAAHQGRAVGDTAWDLPAPEGQGQVSLQGQR